MFLIFSMAFFLVVDFLFFMSFINLSKLLKTFLSPELDLILFVSVLISSMNFIARLKSFLECNYFGNSVSFDSSSFCVSASSVNFCLFYQTIQTVCSQIFSFYPHLTHHHCRYHFYKHCNIFRKAHHHF